MLLQQTSQHKSILPLLQLYFYNVPLSTVYQPITLCCRNRVVERITGTGQLIRWIKCPRPWDKVDDTFLRKWSYSWFCWLGYFSWRFDGFSCNSLIFSERRNRHSWYLTVLNRQTVKPSRHFSKSGSALVTWPTRYTSPTSSTIEPSSRLSWKTLQTRGNLHIFMRPPCIPLATLLGRLSFWHP